MTTTTLSDTLLAGSAMAAGTTKLLLVLPSVWIWNYFYVVYPITYSEN
jgi:hypothetical protein